MNEDHAEAVALYARVFAQLAAVESAQMLAIDPDGMDLQAVIEGTPQTVRVPFDHSLQDSEDAHQTLIAMVKQARTRIS
jgi:putative heme iron utilization protein